MSLLIQIRADRDAARKAGDKSRVASLTTLYSEAATVGKNNGNRESTDDETISVIKKFVANGTETLGHLRAKKGADPAAVAHLESEIAVFSGYLPAMVKEDDIRAFIQTTIAGGANAIGPVMGAVKKQFGASADMKIASRIAKEILG